MSRSMPGVVFSLLTLTGAGVLLLTSADSPGRIGLAIQFENGIAKPLLWTGDQPRYLQEVDLIVTAAASDKDEGILPLQQTGDFATLDWSGVSLVEEDWRPNGDGTWMRQRFYRNAAWMNRPSTFAVYALDRNGKPISWPAYAYAGFQDRTLPADDGAVRRFVARQIASPCPAKDNCGGAKFTAQALVQWRQSLNPEKRAVRIPEGATHLYFYWTEQRATNRVVALDRRKESELPYGFGLQTQLRVLNAPANGKFYLPGDKLRVKLTLTDANGLRLHPDGSLPTYNQFLKGEVTSGLQYADGPRLIPSPYYALMHREGNLMVGLVGPADRIRQSRTILPVEAWQQDQVQTAFADVDGYTGILQTKPEAKVLAGPATGYDAPVSDLVEFTIPQEAQPGTYILSVKARRVWAGEALNRGASLDIQIGMESVTNYEPQVGNCSGCHRGNASLALVNHGMGDLRTCQVCHTQQANVPDSRLDCRIHIVHQRSPRFGGNPADCATCHLTPPSGPGRCFLP